MNVMQLPPAILALIGVLFKLTTHFVSGMGNSGVRSGQEEQESRLSTV